MGGIDKAGANRAARHRAEFRARFTLREGQAAGGLDRTQSVRAIGSIPDKITPIAREPQSSASDSKKWSIARLSRCALRINFSAPSFTMTHLFGGWT